MLKPKAKDSRDVAALKRKKKDAKLEHRRKFGETLRADSATPCACFLASFNRVVDSAEQTRPAAESERIVARAVAGGAEAAIQSEMHSS
jgi:hypothetical protein